MQPTAKADTCRWSPSCPSPKMIVKTWKKIPLVYRDPYNGLLKSFKIQQKNWVGCHPQFYKKKHQGQLVNSPLEFYFLFWNWSITMTIGKFFVGEVPTLTYQDMIYIYIPPWKIAWQWIIHHLKMYFLLNIGNFPACHLSLRGLRGCSTSCLQKGGLHALVPCPKKFHPRTNEWTDLFLWALKWLIPGT